MTSRLLRWMGSAVAALVVALGLGVAAALPAHASDDAFDTFDVVATLTPEGVVQVSETITLRFGSGSGRHGLERTLITREPSGDMDAVYEIEDVSVTSPDNVSTQLDLTTVSEGRTEYLRIRVGDPDVTISAPTATYVLSYRISGLMRSFSDYDELYWDITGSSMPWIEQASARVTVPGGALDVFCSVAEPGEVADCDTARVSGDDVAEFGHGGIPTGQLMTVSVKVGSGLVSDNEPHLVENADEASARTGGYVLAGSSALAVLVPFVGWLYWRRHGPDRRFDGLPPGVLPAPGEVAREVRNSSSIVVPVSFSPPRLSLAEAGLLLTGSSEIRHTTATLVGLAVNGAIRLRSEEPPEAQLVDASRATDLPSQVLLGNLFRSGGVADLAEPGGMVGAHDGVAQVASEAADANGWFVSRAGTATARTGLTAWIFPAAFLGIAGLVFLGPVMLLVLPLGLSLVVTAAVVGAKLRRGQRSGLGRALTDQVEGFRTYIATAEAEQLQFEEGEDIFSKYLPWAILFDLTDRWTQVCERLVAMGRLSAAPPAWYYGSTWDLHWLAWQMDAMNSHVATASAPAPSFDDTGFGHSDSAFGGGGGGGFSGGGGGGGGGGSW